MMDFSKLKELLTGIPSNPDEANAVESKNKETVGNMLGAAKKTMSGAPMTEGEQAESEATKKSVDEAGRMAAAFGGTIANVGSVPAEMAESGAGKIVQSIMDKMKSGDRLSTAEEMLAKNAGIRTPGARGGTYNVEPLGAKPIMREQISAQAPAAKVMPEAAAVPKAEGLGNTPSMDTLQKALQSPEGQEFLSRFANRRMTGAY